MSIVEILDSLGIDSFNMQSYINECQRYRTWYCKLGTQEIDEVEMAKAYLKIDHKMIIDQKIQVYDNSTNL